jgi:hypothetical protein
MKRLHLIAVAATTLTLSLSALAGVSAQEAAQLGKNLTPMGAVKAGNAAGTIPEYTGGRTTPPAGWVKNTTWIDPYKGEKPILKIDASNASAHASKLSAGQLHLLKTLPGYYINVFPTHRDYAFPRFVQDGTVKNASNPECKTDANGVVLAKACRGGYPFPIPKTGYEVMWNKLINYSPPSRSTTTNWLVYAGGNPHLTSALITYRDNLNYFGGDGRENTEAFSNILAQVTAPSRIAGTSQGQMDFINPLKMPRRAFLYFPGQRRVRMAPEFSYDMPHANLGGSVLYDEIFLFVGAMDRFDFKLVGKKEAYIPANNNQLIFVTDSNCKAPQVLKSVSVDPECTRFELRRVWEVEATLKPGYKHVYGKRHWLIEEDSYTSATYDAWDSSNKLIRTGLGYTAQIYDPENLGVYSAAFAIWDIQKKYYALASSIDKISQFGNPMREIDTQPEAVAARSAR